MDGIILILIGIIWVISLIVRGLKALIRVVTGSGTTAATTARRSAMDEAQRLALAQAAQKPQPQPPPTLGRPPLTPPPARRERAPQQRRRPEAGGPAVTREATDADFRRQEQQLIADEPTRLDTPSGADTPAGTPAPALFTSGNDLVRAIIMQEVLGPPLSRRSHASQPQKSPLED